MDPMAGKTEGQQRELADGSDDLRSPRRLVVDPIVFMQPLHLVRSGWQEHVPFAFWLTATHRPATFVELGTQDGVSYFAFCQAIAAAGLATRCYAVDARKGDEDAGAHAAEAFRVVRDHNDRLYSHFSTLMPMRSDDGVEHFADGEIDLLHIDGDHTHQGARHDFQTWLPKLSTRAIVVLHDTSERMEDFGLVPFADELRARYPVVELTQGNGLTVVAVGKDQRPEMAELFRTGDDSTSLSELRAMFGRLGKACAEESSRLGDLEGARAAAEAALAQRDDELEAVRANLRVAARSARARGAELSAARREVAETSRTLDAATERAAAQKREISRMRGSMSWRLTAPLRAVARGLRRRPRTTPRSTAGVGAGNAAKRPAGESGAGARPRPDGPALNARWYARYYPDVAVSGLDAVTHYEAIGAAEGRYATPDAFRLAEVPEFDAAWYLDTYPDVARAGMDPLLHYAFHGRAEKRAPSKAALPEGRVAIQRSYRSWDVEAEQAFLTKIGEVYRRHQDEVDRNLVSVVMPTYDRAGQIAAAVRSVLAQSHENLELIIADDGSTDDTEAVVAALADSRIRYLKLTRQGVSGARNAGLAAATGAFVCYLDSDNTWTSDHVRHLVTFLASTGSTLAYSGLRANTDDGTPPYYRGAPFDFEVCLRGNYVDLNAVGHRRRDDAQHQFDRGLKRLVDWDFLLRLTRGTGAVFLPYVGVEYYAGRRFARITTTEHQGPELRDLAAKIQSRHALNGAPAPGVLSWREALEGPSLLVGDAEPAPDVAADPQVG